MFSINSYLFIASSQHNQEQMERSLETLNGISYNSKIYYLHIQDMVLDIYKIIKRCYLLFRHFYVLMKSGVNPNYVFTRLWTNARYSVRFFFLCGLVGLTLETTILQLFSVFEFLRSIQNKQGDSANSFNSLSIGNQWEGLSIAIFYMGQVLILATFYEQLFHA